MMDASDQSRGGERAVQVYPYTEKPPIKEGDKGKDGVLLCFVGSAGRVSLLLLSGHTTRTRRRVVAAVYDLGQGEDAVVVECPTSLTPHCKCRCRLARSNRIVHAKLDHLVKVETARKTLV